MPAKKAVAVAISVGLLPVVAISTEVVTSSTNTTFNVAAADLSHGDIIWLAEHQWGIHSTVISAMEEQGGFALDELDCDFLDALKQEPFTYMAFKKFCKHAEDAKSKKYSKTVGVDGTTLSIAVTTDDEDTARSPRRLASSAHTYSGIHIKRDNSSLAMGVNADVRLYRKGVAALAIDADAVLVENDLHVGGRLYANGTAVSLSRIAENVNTLVSTTSGSANVSVVTTLPNECSGRTWVANIGLFECINEKWTQTYDASCDDNIHSPESHVLCVEQACEDRSVIVHDVACYHRCGPHRPLYGRGSGTIRQYTMSTCVVVTASCFTGGVCWCVRSCVWCVCVGMGVYMSVCVCMVCVCARARLDRYNGGAEMGVDTDGYANGWEYYMGFDDVDASQGEVTSEFAMCGRHSFHWKSTKSSTDWDLIEQSKSFRFEMEAGCTYGASFWAYCTGLNREVGGWLGGCAACVVSVRQLAQSRQMNCPIVPWNAYWLCV